MGTKQSYVIIGNGIAGITAAEILRNEDASCTITIVADDPFPAYYRPALKDYLSGCLPVEKLWARSSTFYKEKRIKFVPARVIGINTRKHTVSLHDGKSISYSKLLLANGARPRTLSCPGLDLAGVFTLRTVADYQQILHRLSDVKRVVICGSGTLALESAETLYHCGYQVTHLVRGKALWSEVLDPVASDMVIQEELRDGIDVRMQEEIAEIVGKNGQVSHVITKHADKIACEMVLIAIGIEPLTDFIHISGILCGRGVKVNNGMCTNIPDIYAAGDVVEVTDKFTGHTRVIGQWFPSIQQAQVAAYNMLGLFPPHAPFNPSSNSESSFAHLNYYSAAFLYGLEFVAVGLSTCPRSPDYQEIVADPMPRKYRKVVLKNGVIVGTLLLGECKQGLAFKRAIDHHVNIASIAHQIFADDFRFDAWLNEQGIPGPILNIIDEGSRETSLPEPRETVSMPRLTSGKPSSDEALIPNYIIRALKDLPTLVLVSQNKPSRVLTLEYGQRYTLGRDSHCDIVLDDPSSSRLHAEIFSASDGFYVRDLDSRYGVFVNKVKINKAHRLLHKDRIVVGNILIHFSHPQANALRQAASGPSKLTKQTSSSGLSREEVAITERLERGVPVKTRGKEPIVVGLEHRREVQPLGEDQVKFEIDMCIGCNRCMEACPLPMSSQVNIADLNQAVVSEQVNSHIARFTDECLMCSSCVPVCPVNNHRDLLMLSLKQRIGISWDSQPNMNRAIAMLPAGWTIATLLSRLREQAILRDPQQVPDNYLLHIIVASKQQIFRPGEIVISEGEYGRDLYLILDGSLELTVADSNNGALLMAILGRGKYVGEDGMLTGYPYKASVRAKTSVLLLQVPEQVIRRLMELVLSVRNHFEQVNNVRSLKPILKRMALFQGVTDGDIEAFIQHTLIRRYERDEQLFTEEKSKHPSREIMHIILEGVVKVARKATVGTHSTENDERIIAYRQGGDYFAGGFDLLGNGRAVKVRTITRCRVAEVPQQVLQALCQKYPEVKQRFSIRLREYLEATVSAQGYESARLLQRFAPIGNLADLNVQASLHSLVNNGVVEGTEVLVIDLDKCIHCNECENACARRHGYSRMNRKGMVVGNISIATACRQCQDPVCMLCSRAGIARHPNGEVYITESCIGCGICVERCPYDNISIITLEEEIEGTTPLQRFSSFFMKVTKKQYGRKMLPLAKSQVAPGPLAVGQSTDPVSEMRKKVAIKCDLCAGYNDQACVQACPTGAAIRVQPTKFFGSTEDILHR